MSIKHAKALTAADNGNPNEVQPSDWNGDHQVDGLLGALLALGIAADRMPYLDSNSQGALAPLSEFMRGLLGSTNLAGLLSALNVVSKAGDSMAGALGMSGNKVTGLGAPTSATDAATKAYVDALAAVVSGALVFKGAWDASSGTFPAGDGIKTGWFYKVDVAGVVNGVDFDQGDEIFAVVDAPSSTIYEANWLRIEGTITVAEIESVLGFAFGTAASKNVGLAAGNVVQLDGTGKLPAIDASQLMNIPGGFSGKYADLTGKPTLGTAAALSAGASANNVVQLDGSANLPSALLASTADAQAGSDAYKVMSAARVKEAIAQFAASGWVQIGTTQTLAAAAAYVEQSWTAGAYRQVMCIAFAQPAGGTEATIDLRTSSASLVVAKTPNSPPSTLKFPIVADVLLTASVSVARVSCISSTDNITEIIGMAGVNTATVADRMRVATSGGNWTAGSIFSFFGMR